MKQFLAEIKESKLTIFLLILLGAISFFAGVIVSSDSALEEKAALKVPFGIGPWPKDIKYYNDSGYDKTLKVAINQWRQTGIPVRFSEVKNKDQANLIINDSNKDLKNVCEDKDLCVGYAQIGYAELRFKKSVLHIAPAINQNESKTIDIVRIQTMIHELGHILGLFHNDNDCSIMNKDSSCPRKEGFRITRGGSYFRCGPWPRDVEEIRELYNVDSTKKTTSICQDQSADIDYYKKLILKPKLGLKVHRVD
jgi:hypothetical protein